MIKPFFKKLINPISQDQKGATLLIAALILALLTVFVATALINTSSSGISINNDARTKNSFYASYAALEKMSKEFSDVFTANLSPTPSQLSTIKANAEALATANTTSTDPAVIVKGMVLKTDIRKADFASTGITLTNGPYSGLKTLREEYVFTATTTSNSGVTVQLSRSLYNNLIPIFQFGIFSTRHLEFYNGPTFNFGGRVHANRDIYLTPQATTVFSDRVTTVGQITYGKLRNGSDRNMTNGWVQFTNSSGTLVPLTQGSVKGSSTGAAVPYSIANTSGGPNVTPTDPRPGHPSGFSNATAFNNFITTSIPGQVFVKAPVLKLPIQNTNNRPIEIIRRGLQGEDFATSILAQSRFYNKAGLRITLSDTQAQLPDGIGGVRLDSDKDDTNTTYTDGRLGYKPQKLGTYEASRINGHRIKGWIKVEALQRQNDGTITSTDITKAILALGVTKYDNGLSDRDEVRILGTSPLTVPTTSGFTGFDTELSNFNNLDDRNSVLCLQHYSLLSSTAITRSDGGSAVHNSLSGATRNNLIVASTPIKISASPLTFINNAPAFTNATAATPIFPLVDNVPDTPANSDTPGIIYAGGTIPAIAALAATTTPPSLATLATPVRTKLLPSGMLIPYPINMYDQREGGALDSAPAAPNSTNLHLNGVMSLIDIDMQNLKKLLTGGFDADFANATSPAISFRARNISSESNGWIIYISDRRGDTYDPTASPLATRQFDNYGRYDMETNYGNTTSANPRTPYIPGAGQTLFEIEDTNDNGVIEYPGPTNTEGALPDQYIDVIDAITKGPWHPNVTRDNISPFTSVSQIFATGNQDRTRIRLDNAASAIQTPLFRRGVRLSNGATISPDLSNLTRAAETTNDKPLNLNRGITIACENAVYVLGNYNTSGVNSFPATATNFTGNEVPAAIISDSVTLLSKGWKDTNMFTSPYAVGGRPVITANETQYRFAAFTGRTRDGLFFGNNDTTPWGTLGFSGTANTPLTPSGLEKDDVRLYGGVHNFLRYLEDWRPTGTSYKLSYCGSIIDGWDSFQANGTFKCCNTVYDAPTRDYTFNTAFQSVDRLPPGTPNLQYILFTNFRENVNPKQF